MALDQATKTVGWSLFNGKKLIRYGVKNFSGELDERISKIKDWLNKLIKETESEIFIIEDTQQQENPHVFKILSELLGVLSNNFFEHEYLYTIIEPTKWKGYCEIKGKKREEQKINSIKVVKERFGIDVGEDEADAINIGWYGVNVVMPMIKGE